MPRTIIRGDSYAIRQPFYIITILDEDGNPMDLTGCKVFTTYKPSTSEPSFDPDDENAPIKHKIEINSSGVVTESEGLVLQGTAAQGVLIERLTSAESAVVPLNMTLKSDIQIIDSLNETFTFIMSEEVTAIDGYTNRTT